MASGALALQILHPHATLIPLRRFKITLRDLSTALRCAVEDLVPAAIFVR